MKIAEAEAGVAKGDARFGDGSGEAEARTGSKGQENEQLWTKKKAVSTGHDDVNNAEGKERTRRHR